MSSQPTEPGWYWARFAGADGPSRWTPVEVCFVYEHEKDRRELGDHRLWLVKDWRFVDDSGIEWGPRIPEPVEHYGHRDPLLAAAFRFGVELGRQCMREAPYIRRAEEAVYAALSYADTIPAADRNALLADIKEHLRVEEREQ